VGVVPYLALAVVSPRLSWIPDPRARGYGDLRIGLAPINCIRAFLRIASLPSGTHLSVTRNPDIFGAAVATV
jgi:hypothetical protein